MIELQIADTTAQITAAAGPYALAFAVGLIAGAALPFHYAMERFRGFGRVAVDRLPYRPPPGRDEERALIEATESDGAEESED